MMTSSQLLPTILLPTKLNKQHGTLFDNMFTNQFNPDMSSGNFTFQISDHLASFSMVPNVISNENQQFLPKKHNIFKWDTKHFNQCEFIKEISQLKCKSQLQ